MTEGGARDNVKCPVTWRRGQRMWRGSSGSGFVSSVLSLGKTFLLASVLADALLSSQCVGYASKNHPDANNQQIQINSVKIAKKIQVDKLNSMSGPFLYPDEGIQS